MIFKNVKKHLILKSQNIEILPTVPQCTATNVVMLQSSKTQCRRYYENVTEHKSLQKKKTFKNVAQMIIQIICVV